MKQQYISIRHLSKKFNKDFVLKDINAVLNSNEILGFLGPSGAGKTTTIKILTGQLKPTSGNAEILGIECDKINERIYEQIGIVTDSSGVYERMNLYDNLKYFARILNVPSENIDLLLKRIGLYEHRKKMAGKLSKGQRQRLILARAILHRPKVLFLDEPTNGLDPSASNEIHKLLMELKNEGMAIFLTTHNMEEAAKLCDNVALLNDGVIVEYGSPQAICLKHNQIKKYRVRLTDGTTHLLLQNEKTTGQIAQWMNSGQLETIHSCEPTLETVFLDTTGRNLQCPSSILHRPKVLFLDEPTNGLDPSASNEIHKLLMELKNEGMAIFLTTHNMEEAAKLCDNVALLNDGVIVEYGSPQAICLKHNQIKKYRVRLTDGTTHLLLQNEKTTGQIAQWMNSGQLETIHSCEPTLETVFLDTTGRNLQ